MKECPSFEDIAAFIDGESEADAAAIAHHLTTCADCSETAAEINLINLAVREKESRVAVPTSMSDWPYGRTNRGTLRISRRKVIGGMALAASTAVAAFFLTRGGGSALAMEPTLFRDYATLVAANGPLDFESGSPERVLAWFRTRVPFPLPPLGDFHGVEVRGGRLCWLLERRVAALHLGQKTAGACLYMTTPQDLTVGDGIPLPAPGEARVLLSQGAMSGAFWRQDALAFGLVGDQAEAEIGMLAERLRGSG